MLKKTSTTPGADHKIENSCLYFWKIEFTGSKSRATLNQEKQPPHHYNFKLPGGLCLYLFASPYMAKTKIKNATGATSGGPQTTPKHMPVGRNDHPSKLFYFAGCPPLPKMVHLCGGWRLSSTKRIPPNRKMISPKLTRIFLLMVIHHAPVPYLILGLQNCKTC
jgi:hypothetical protein